MQTPCTKVCTLDAAQKRCIGCGRTLDEIARWGGTTGSDRESVTAQLPARMARLERDGA